MYVPFENDGKVLLSVFFCSTPIFPSKSTLLDYLVNLTLNFALLLYLPFKVSLRKNKECFFFKLYLILDVYVSMYLCTMYRFLKNRSR